MHPLCKMSTGDGRNELKANNVLLESSQWKVQFIYIQWINAFKSGFHVHWQPCRSFTAQKRSIYSILSHPNKKNAFLNLSNKNPNNYYWYQTLLCKAAIPKPLRPVTGDFIRVAQYIFTIYSIILYFQFISAVQLWATRGSLNVCFVIIKAYL